MCNNMCNNKYEKHKLFFFLYQVYVASSALPLLSNAKLYWLHYVSATYLHTYLIRQLHYDVS
jgi:hypothetical protein